MRRGGRRWALREVGRRGVGAGLALGLWSGALVACGAPSAPKVAGKWQATTSAESGLDIRGDGTFQGELGGSGGPRVRLNGKWEAKGNDVTFTLDGPAARVIGQLAGKIDGDTMTLSSRNLKDGSVTLKRRPE